MAEENGTVPPTQISRDVMAQSDHDAVVRLEVMLQTVLSGQTRLEQQIKELIQRQVAALATFEVQAKIRYDALDVRIRKIEDLAVQYVPMAQDFETRINKNEDSIASFASNRTEIVGGWKTLAWIAGATIFLTTLVYYDNAVFSCVHTCK